MTQLKLTPMERKLYEALSDGKPHHPDDLASLMDEDGLYTRSCLYALVGKLRVKLNFVGEDIVAQYFGRNRVGYRRVRQLVVRMD